jgi:uncharacterized protein YdeI (YjbR/CyaY-like superfamily)
MEFKSATELHAWLKDHHSRSSGIWVRLFKKRSGHTTVSFAELLDEGLSFGWSESMRRQYDASSYLQKFTPRKTIGTTSLRNQASVEVLISQGRITPSGLKALGL